jgi:hypothetical protein
MIERKRMTTRVGLGSKGALIVETDDTRIIDLFPDGVRAEFSTDLEGVDWVSLFAAKPNGTKCHFHQHGKLHKVSITERHLTGVDFEPFRLAKVGDTVYQEDHENNEHSVDLQLANARKKPRRKTGGGSARGPSKPFSGTPTPGQRELPLEPSEVETIEDLRQAMAQANRIALNLDVELCFDEDGLLYAAIKSI